MVYHVGQENIIVHGIDGKPNDKNNLSFGIYRSDDSILFVHLSCVSCVTNKLDRVDSHVI